MNAADTAIKGILFDKDGTLFDFAATWEIWAAKILLRASCGDVDHARQAGRRIGFDLEKRRFAKDSIVIAGTAGEVGDALLPLYPQYTHDTLLSLLNEEAAIAPQVEVLPLVPFLQKLRAQGFKTGVATNDAEAPARVHLDGAGIAELFDFIAGFDSGYGGKPGAGQLLAFAKSVDLRPDQIVMVGDSPHDLNAGRAAGMATIGVLTGINERAVLEPLADVILADIGALPAWLQEQARSGAQG